MDDSSTFLLVSKAYFYALEADLALILVGGGYLRSAGVRELNVGRCHLVTSIVVRRSALRCHTFFSTLTGTVLDVRIIVEKLRRLKYGGGARTRKVLLASL